jgi:hypothetical protein
MNLVTSRGFPIVNYVLIFLIIEMMKYTTVFETSDGSIITCKNFSCDKISLTSFFLFQVISGEKGEISIREIEPSLAKTSYHQRSN